MRQATVKEKPVSNSPIYCKDCNSRESWERVPQKDHMFEGGKVFQEAWGCRNCHAITWRLPRGYAFGK